MFQAVSQSDPAEIRSQVDALRKLAPEMGLPDILLASLEAREGRPDAAAQLLATAAGKDLTWLPDFELARLAILRELESGKPSLEGLRNLFSIALPSCLVLRNIAREFLPSSREGDEGSPGEAAVESGAESAPEILRLGRSLQGEGGFLIHNLVGGAIVEMSLKEIEASRELTPEEAALRDRTRSIQSLATLFSDRLEQVLLAEPDLVPVYLRDVAEHGEAVAARRTLINYLAREVSR